MVNATRLLLIFFAFLVSEVAPIAADELTTVQETAPISLYSPRALVERIQSGEPVTFVDVRQPEEFSENHIPGAINIPQGQLSEMREKIPKEGLVVPYCNMDFRGFVAAREIEALGAERVGLMQERGIEGWVAQDLPVVSEASGLTDSEGVAQLRTVSPAELLGEKYVQRAPASGRVYAVEMTADEWYFEPNDLTVEAGDTVEISIKSTKGHHYFVLPDYELSVHLPEGETRRVRFVADLPGDFRFGSCEWDGSNLQVMKGRLRVVRSKE